MSVSNIIRVGVIGAGGNTRAQHIPKLQEIPGVSIQVVSNRTDKSAEAVATQFGIPKAVADWRAVIEDPSIDAVVIGTWPNMHSTLVLEALRAGKHVLCEARMAMNHAESLEMLAEQKRHPTQVAQIVPSPYSLPYDETIRNIIKYGGVDCCCISGQRNAVILEGANTFSAGTLGRLTYITVRNQGSWPEAEGSPMVFRHDTDLSGQNIMSLGILYEALARWVGHTKQVTAMGQTVVRMRKDWATGNLKAVEVPDHIDVLAQMTCGAQAHFVISTVAGGEKPVMEFWLHGTEASLHLDINARTLRLIRKPNGEGAKPTVEDVPLVRPAGWRVEQEFIGAIRGTETVQLTDFVTATRYMEFTTAVARSLQSGATVSLPLA